VDGRSGAAPPSPETAPRPRTVTLRALAEQVGVDPSTVSRVLNHDPSVRISAATRARILEAATASGYRPNRLARSLKLQRTGIVGMLIPDVTNPLFSALFRAVDDAASAAGYHVILCNTDDSEPRLRQQLDALSEGHVDGLLVATARRGDGALDALRERGVPYVLVNRHRDAPDESWVVPDDRQAAHQAIAHLVGLGHRRIAHVAGAADVSRSAARLAGFRAAMAAAGCPDETWLAAAGDLDETAGEVALARLLALPPAQRPTAVFAANDQAALGVVAAARRAGLHVPDDLSVVGSDDIPAGRYASPPITTIHVPVQDMGRLATELLVRQLRAPASAATPPTQRVLPVALVVRGSTAPARAGAAASGV
jgi:LacI family transcriptional regulator